MSKKVTILIICVSVCTTTLLLFFHGNERTDEVQLPQPENTGGTSPDEPTPTPPPPPIATTTPQSATTTQPQSVSISGNPAQAEKVLQAARNTWQPVDYEGMVLATTTAQWTIEYNHVAKTLTIVVVGFPGSELQQVAEQELLRMLGMSEADVCQLGVTVLWDNFETQFDFQDKKLTFCN